MQAPVSSAAISAAVGFVLSLLIGFVPGLRAKLAAVPSQYKPLAVLGLCAVVAAALVGLACVGVDTGSGAVCPSPDLNSLYAFAASVLAALGGAQSAFALIVKPISGGEG